jgi:hypothetical protein
MNHRLSLVALAGAALALTALSVAPADAATTSPNLIHNAGAETTKAAPSVNGGKVAVTGWTVASKYEFTAVRYGSPEFLTASSPGPKVRGRNFFAGGPSGTVSKGAQSVSLTAYKTWIASGKAKFKLAGWFGGFSTQGDHASLTVTWESSAGKVLGHTTVGPVSEAARHGKSELLYRSATASVPKSARKAFVTLTMVRTDGVYVDGYADNLSLVVDKT